MAAAQTKEEQADARDVIAQVHDPAVAAAGTAAAAAAAAGHSDGPQHK